MDVEALVREVKRLESPARAESDAMTLEALTAELVLLESPGLVDDLPDLLARSERAESRAMELGAVDLAYRARLTQADALIRSGRTAAGGRIAREVNRSAESGGDAYLQARAARLMALFFRHLGDRQAMLEHAVRSVDRLPEDAPAWVRIDHELMLGIALAMMGSFDSARRVFAKLRSALEDSGSRLPLLGVLNNSAYTEYEAGDAEAALGLARSLSELAERTGIEMRPAWADTMGRCLMANGLLVEARDVLLKATDPQVAALAVDGDAVATCLLSLAEVQRRLGEVEEAAAVLERCLAISDERGLAEVHARVRFELSQLFAAQGRWREAYEQHVVYHEEWERVSSAERDAHARIIHAVYETTAAREESERYRELAMRDPLTGLANRRYVQERVPPLLDEAERTGASVAVALVDLDHFKRINDSLSHDAGDAVLIAVGRLLAEYAADGVAARMGGEEFLLVLTGIDLESAPGCFEELRAAIESHDWSAITGAMPVTASLGVAVTSQSRRHLDELLRAADALLYAAKRGGRNRVVAA